jgi:Zn-dependent membrane protease YugP
MYLMMPSYWLFILPALILAVIATWVTQTTFARYSRVRARSGLTGAEAAQALLRSQGIYDVRIERVSGFLTDHYDPFRNVLRLSPDVYDSDSLAAIGVACHEAGHALQKATAYAPLSVRTNLVPVTQIGSQLAFPVILAGLVLQRPGLFTLGIWMFVAVVIFTLITLPVEWNASRRAKQLMVAAGIVTPQELPHAAAVLNAAFLTYVASAVSAVMTLLYYLSLGSRRR